MAWTALERDGNERPRLAAPAHSTLPAIDIDFTEERPRRFGDYVAMVRRNLRLALTCFGVTLALAVIAVIVMPRRYTAAVRVHVFRQSPIQLRLDKNVISLDDTVRTEHGELAFLATHVAALKSRDLAERVIRRYGLDRSEAFLDPRRHRDAPLPVPPTVRPLMRPGVSESFPIEPRPSAPPDARPIDPKLIDRYLRWLTVRDVPGTDLVEIAFGTPSARLSTFLAAAHTRAYVEAIEDARRATDAVASAFLGRKLADSRRHLKQVERTLARFASDHPEVAADQEAKIATQRIGELTSSLTKAETTRMALESQYEFLSNARTDPLGYFLDHPGVEKLRLALLDVQAQEAALDGRLGENHPRMIELKRLETELARQIRAEIGRDVASVRARYDAASARETRIRERLKRQQETDTQLARLGTRYQLLKNDVETARGLHTSLLQQQMATAANSNLESTNLTVVERADVPRWPSRPKIPLTLALGVAAGLVFGLGAAFTRDYFDHSLRSSEDVETQLQLPALATIPNFALARRMSGAPLEPPRPGANGSSHTPELIVHHEPESYVAEAFRTVRTTLLLPTSGEAPHVIVVTSARAGEGKTIASLNLATALVQSGARVVLVEADLRHPRCHRALRLPTGAGLSQHLADGRSELDRLVRVIEPPGISFLPAGRLPCNPMELLGSSRMADVMATLRARYDFVIVDTPPAGPVSDAALIARHADGILLVVKGGATPREIVRRTRDRLVHTGARFLGVIVNDVRLEWENGYGYGYAYGYGPHHGDRGARAASFLQAITGIVRGERAV